MISALTTPVRANGGTTIVFVGPPNTAIWWTLAGLGTLTRASEKTNGAGVATAYYNAQGLWEGEQITVTVEICP